MMHPKDAEMLAGIGLLVVASVVVGMLCHFEGQVSVRREAVREGAAQWVAAESGRAEFRWNKPEVAPSGKGGRDE